MTTETEDLYVNVSLFGIRLSALRGTLEGLDGVLSELGLEASDMLKGDASELSDHSLSLLESLPQALDEVSARLDALQAAAEPLSEEELAEEGGPSPLALRLASAMSGDSEHESASQ